MNNQHASVNTIISRAGSNRYRCWHTPAASITSSSSHAGNVRVNTPIEIRSGNRSPATLASVVTPATTVSNCADAAPPRNKHRRVTNTAPWPLPATTPSPQFNGQFRSNLHQHHQRLRKRHWGIPWVEPTDVSEALVWLASDAARYVTGVVLPVDAGTTLL